MAMGGELQGKDGGRSLPQKTCAVITDVGEDKHNQATVENVFQRSCYIWNTMLAYKVKQGHFINHWRVNMHIKSPHPQLEHCQYSDFYQNWYIIEFPKIVQ